MVMFDLYIYFRWEKKGKKHCIWKEFGFRSKVLSLLEACFILIWSRAPHLPWKYKSWAGKLLKIWGSNPSSGRSLSFSFLTQNWVSLILTTFWYFVLLIRNHIKHAENLCFYWYLICKTRYSKIVKNKDLQFFRENLKIKIKKDKNF